MLRTGPVLLLVVEKTGKITPSPSRRELSRENDPSTTTTMASARSVPVLIPEQPRRIYMAIFEGTTGANRWRR